MQGWSEFAAMLFGLAENADHNIPTIHEDMFQDLSTSLYGGKSISTYKFFVVRKGCGGPCGLVKVKAVQSPSVSAHIDICLEPQRLHGNRVHFLFQRPEEPLSEESAPASMCLQFTRELESV